MSLEPRRLHIIVRNFSHLSAPPFPPTARCFPNLPSHCNHQNYLMAGGGKSGHQKVYFWTCQGCGNRWERVSADRATNGHGLTTTEPSPAHGQLRPRTAPVPAPSAAPANVAASQRERSPSASEAPTDVPIHQMHDLSDIDEEESEIEIIPTLRQGQRSR